MTNSRQDKAYQYIRRQLARGGWQEGQMLSPAEVAKEIGISYTPVREAMIQLAAEGLLEQRPQGRVCVKSLDREELLELFELRRTLEGGAAELAAEKITPAQLSELDAYCLEHRKTLEMLHHKGWLADDEESLSTLRRMDIQFHLTVIAAAGNPKISKMINDLQLLTRIFQRQIPMIPETPSKHAYRVYAFHRRVLEALRNGDGEAARTWMTRHLRWAQEYHLAYWNGREREKQAAHLEEVLWA